MSNYTKSTNFATKDNLTPGDPLKVVRGTEIDTEFNNISTAIATKTDNSAAAITGGTIDGATVGATTPATGAFTTLAASGTTTLAGALVGAATQSAFNTVSTTLNLGGAATALNLGAATGTATVNNTTLAAKAITASTTLAVTGTSTLTGAVTATAGVSGPITSSSVSITGGSITGITDLAVADGGTGASTAADGLNNLLPSQTGNANKYLQTDGTNASWDAVSLSTADITGTLGAANGGTGVSNNAAMTVTGSGNFAYTRTLTGTTNVTFPTTGTLATLAGTETLTNKTLTSPTLVTPTLGVATGTSFQGIIGNVTPAAGSFTTLGASSTATLNTLSSSGATLTGGTINGMTVGATTASTGAFTTLTTSSTVTHNGGTANGVTYLNGSKVLTSGSALTFDGTNLSTTGSISTSSTSGYNVQVSGGNAYRMYATTNDLVFRSVTAGSDVMTLTYGGNVGIGTSSPAYKLDVNGTANISGIITASATGGYFANNGATTSGKYISIANTGGTSQIGVESSAGGTQIVGSSAYMTAITGKVGIGFSGNDGSALHMTLSSAGNLAVTGAISTTTKLAGGYVAVDGVVSDGGSNTYDLLMSNRGTFRIRNTADTGWVRFGYVDASDNVVLGPTGKTKVVTTLGVGNVTPSTSGAGITFPATQSASSDANTLDDYEEGTWTPADGSGASLSFTGVVGTYTKIGRCVTALAELTYPTTASGLNAIITGLPFTSGASGGINGYIRYTTVATSLLTFVTGGPASTSVSLLRPGVNTTNVSMSAGTLLFAVIYYV